MEPGPHPDPLAEALAGGPQKVAQIASLATAMSQVLIQQLAIREARKAISDEQALRVLAVQERQITQQIRAAWAPAHDRKWLADADLLQTARVWAAAVAHADTDPTAAVAQRKCEDRLRRLHPYAMAFYDRIRGDGTAALDAMRRAAPMFSREPHVRVGDPVPARQSLTVNGTTEVVQPDARAIESGGSMDHSDEAERVEYRARHVAQRLQARVQASGRPPLGRDELIIVLESVTNLPESTIEVIADEAAGTGRAPNGPAQQAASNFPRKATDAVRTAGRPERAGTRSPVGLTPLSGRQHSARP
jgi:hypothetical protein